MIIYYAKIQKIINYNAVIFGDFINLIDWSTLSLDKEGSRLIKFAQDMFLHQIVGKETRGKNILDLVLTNKNDLILTWEVGEPLASSNHNIVRCVLNIEKKAEAHFLLIPSYRKTNFSNLKRELASINWRQLLYSPNVEDTYNRFTTQLTASVNNYIPYKPLRPTSINSSCMTRCVLNIIIEKRKLYT